MVAPPAPTPSMSLADQAVVVGRHAWWERRLFELTGAWAVTRSDPALTVALAVQSSIHGERAERWHRRLPALAGWDAEQLTAAPGAPARRVVDALAALGASGGADGGAGVDPAAVLYRLLLPASLASYRAHLARASEVSDGPVLRVLRETIPALEHEIAAGEALVAARGAG